MDYPADIGTPAIQGQMGVQFRRWFKVSFQHNSFQINLYQVGRKQISQPATGGRYQNLMVAATDRNVPVGTGYHTLMGQLSAYLNDLLPSFVGRYHTDAKVFLQREEVNSAGAGRSNYVKTPVTQELWW